MGIAKARDIESRFARYVDGLVSVIGHADRVGPLHDYLLGLVLPGERKSVEPMAAITAPERTAAQHQSLLHFVGAGGWSDDAMLGKVREMVLPKIESYGPIEAWIIDDTGLPNASRASAGQAFGWGFAPILRSARQAGELSGRSDTVSCQPSCEPAGGVSAVSAEGLGRR
jgi:SRSO17 transposase